MDSAREAAGGRKKKRSLFGLGRIGVLIVVALTAIVIIAGGRGIAERADAGYYYVKQGKFAGSFGGLAVIERPGWFLQLWCPVERYKISNAIYMSKEALDGGRGAETGAIADVQFPDGKADIDVVVQYQLSMEDQHQKDLHVRYGSDAAVKSMIRQQVIEAIKNTATLMSAEEAYSEKRPSFAPWSREQCLEGLWASVVFVDTSFIDRPGDEIKEKMMVVTKNYDRRMVVDSVTGEKKTVITKPSVLDMYAITIPQFNVKDIDVDDKIDALIEARKDAIMARQNAVTAKERGDAKIAEARAEKEVEKIAAVTDAEKEKELAVIAAKKKKEVAEQDALAALEEKKAMETRAMAKKRNLELARGLSVRDSFEIVKRMQTEIEVAKAYANWKGPETVIMSGGNGKGGSGVQEALMLRMFQQQMNAGPGKSQ